MQVKVSIWNGAPWASNGKKIDWKQAPFLAQFQGFNIHGCQLENHNKYNCYSPHLWWNSKKYWELNPQEQREYENVRRKTLLYDYCSDRGQLHKECQIN
jgi:xyloglucan:xyloglucosyl transferase